MSMSNFVSFHAVSACLNMACVILQKDCKHWFAELNVDMEKVGGKPKSSLSFSPPPSPSPPPPPPPPSSFLFLVGNAFFYCF